VYKKIILPISLSYAKEIGVLYLKQQTEWARRLHVSSSKKIDLIVRGKSGRRAAI
jgi:hypothetical protein